jgi:DNA-binding beta-propeller fold protein YncE
MRLGRGTRWVRMRAALACAAAAGVFACGRELDLPHEPDPNGVVGDVAYNVKATWHDMPVLVDLVLTRGSVLYGVDANGRVRSWFFGSGEEYTSLDLPDSVIVAADTLRDAVCLCEGRNRTLWVAYARPRPTLLQWNTRDEPIAIDSGLVRDAAFQQFGGIAADPDSDFVYVSDRGASTVTKHAPSRDGGRRVATLCAPGDGDHFVRQPRGLFAFGDSLLVADTGKNWVQVVSTRTPFAGRGQITGTRAAPLALLNPIDVWVDPTGFYYVTDAGHSRVLKLTRRGLVKEVVTERDPRAARRPSTLAASETLVWVEDPDSSRVTLYQLNTTSEGLP